MAFGRGSNYVFGVAINAVNKLSGPARDAKKDYDELIKSVRSGNASIKDAFQAGYFNRELKMMTAGMVAFGLSAKLAADAAPIEMMGRDLQTLGFTAKESGDMLATTLDVSRRPGLLSNWKDLLSNAYDLKSALGGIGTSSDVKAAMETIATLGSGSPGADPERLKSAWTTFFNAYGKGAKNIKLESMDFADWVAATYSEFKTTATEVAAGFGEGAVQLSGYGQKLGTVISMMGAMNEQNIRFEAAGYSAVRIFETLIQNAEKFKKAGITFTDARGQWLQLPDIVRQLQAKFPSLGRGKMAESELVGLQKLGFETRSSKALMAVANSLGKIETVINRQDRGGLARRMAETRVSGTYEKSLTDFRNEMSMLRYDLGQGAIPMMKTFVDHMTTGAGAVRKFHSGLGEARGSVHALGLVLAAPAFVSIIGKLIKLGGLGKAYGAAMTNPAAIVAMAAAAGGAAVYGTGKYFESSWARRQNMFDMTGPEAENILALDPAAQASIVREKMARMALDAELAGITDVKKRSMEIGLQRYYGRHIPFEVWEQDRLEHLTKMQPGPGSESYQRVINSLKETGVRQRFGETAAGIDSGDITYEGGKFYMTFNLPETQMGPPQIRELADEIMRRLSEETRKENMSSLNVLKGIILGRSGGSALGGM